MSTCSPACAYCRCKLTAGLGGGVTNKTEHTHTRTFSLFVATIHIPYSNFYFAIYPARRARSAAPAAPRAPAQQKYFGADNTKNLT